MAKNFWGGLTIFLAAGTVLLIIGPQQMQSPEFFRLTKVAVMIGALSVFLWTFNLWAYQGGAFIALKKLVVNGNYIFMGTVGGALFFRERVTVNQLIRFTLYCMAFLLADRETLAFVRTKLKTYLSAYILAVSINIPSSCSYNLRFFIIALSNQNKDIAGYAYIITMNC